MVTQDFIINITDDEVKALKIIANKYKFPTHYQLISWYLAHKQNYRVDFKFMETQRYGSMVYRYVAYSDEGCVYNPTEISVSEIENVACENFKSNQEVL